MGDVTQILAHIERGDPRAAEQLLPLVYDELRRLAAQKMAHENPGQTLEATALVHEAYVRLVDTEKVQTWDGRGHFFAAAAEAMRRILVERARRKRRRVHGGDLRQVNLDEACSMIDAPAEELVALDEALSRLATEAPEKAELVKLRFFAGCTLEDAAKLRGISLATAKRHWAYARAWLFSALHDPEDS